MSIAKSLQKFAFGGLWVYNEIYLLFILSYMVATTIAPNTSAESISETTIRKALAKESRFSNMPKDEQDVLIKARLAPVGSSDINKTLVFSQKLQEAKINYENAKNDKESQTAILNNHIKKLVDRGEPIRSMNPLDIIEQSVKGEVFDPDKRRIELQPRSETDLVTALKAQLDDKNNTIKVDQSLTEYYNMNEGEIKIRYKNIRTRRRAKKLVELLNTKTPEEIVLHIIGKRKLFVMKSNLRDPLWVDKELKAQYAKYLKPDIDSLKAGNKDDKLLAQQILDKLVAVKRSYGINKIAPLLDLKNTGFN